jgi:hypothetical protein
MSSKKRVNLTEATVVDGYGRLLTAVNEVYESNINWHLFLSLLVESVSLGALDGGVHELSKLGVVHGSENKRRVRCGINGLELSDTERAACQKHIRREFSKKLKTIMRIVKHLLRSPVSATSLDSCPSAALEVVIPFGR